jgi:hypothetical protein
VSGEQPGFARSVRCVCHLEDSSRCPRYSTAEGVFCDEHAKQFGQPKRSASTTQPAVRVYFAGADGTGKTTLVDYVSETYGLPMLNETARAVLAESRKSFPAIRATGASSSAYQRKVFERQLAEESHLSPPYVSDRTLDNLAYAAEHARNFRELYLAVPMDYLAHLRESVVFLVRPQRALRVAASADPFRLLSEWEGQVRIDAVVEALFKLWDVDCIPVAEADSAHRETLVDYVLAARGFRKVPK